MSENKNTNGRLVQPRISSDTPIKWIVTVENMAFFIPTVVLAVIAGIAGIIGAMEVAIGAGVLSLGSLATVAYLVLSSPDHTDARERLRMWVAGRRLKAVLPKQYQHMLGNSAHGVSHFDRDLALDGIGATWQDDGRLVGFVAIEDGGVNTALMNEEEAGQVTQEWGNAIDKTITNFPWGVYSRSGQTNPEDLVAEYESAALGKGEKGHGVVPRASIYAREMLLTAADWFIDTDHEQWQPTPFKHFAVVEVTAADVDQLTNSAADESAGDSRLAKLPIIGARFEPDDQDPDHDEEKTEQESGQHARGETPADRTPNSEVAREEMRLKLRKRLQAVERAMSSVEGVEASITNVPSHSMALVRYWKGDPTITGDDGDALTQTIDQDLQNNNGRVEVGETGTERMLTPSEFDVKDGRIVIGDELARVYHIQGYPAQPEPMFMGELFTKRGVDVSVRMRHDPEPNQRAKNDLEQLVAKAGADVQEMAEVGDAGASAVQTDQDVAAKMLWMLNNRPIQTWQTSMYVTIRVGPEAAWDVIAETGRDFDTLYQAKVKALHEAENEVLGLLRRDPAELSPWLPGNSPEHVRRAFISASPTGRDQYAATGNASKTFRMTGSAIGAMLPWCTATVQEDGGMHWGRNTQNGTAVVADPRERGAPHIFTGGQTRSGKTYSTENTLSEWFAMRDDRHLIVTDTEGGFVSLTEACGGKHIKVDSDTTLNPFASMGPNEAPDFVSSILRVQGIDPAPYSGIIEDASQWAYDNCEGPKPHMDTFIDGIDAVMEDPSAFAFTRHAEEREKKKERGAELLNHLSGFKPGGKYDHLLGTSMEALLGDGTNMGYVDLSEFKETSSAEKSVMLHLLLSQVYQMVKRVDGEVIFLIDEAHFLLHSEEMVEWLQDAARSWARYDAMMWFVTQSPREFIQNATGSSENEENQRRTILDQCGTVQMFRTPRTDEDMLGELGLNDVQVDFVKNRATRGKSNAGYSECLVDFQDHRGWFKLRVQADPFSHLLWTYDGDEPFADYVSRRWDWRMGTEPPNPVAAAEGVVEQDPAELASDRRTVSADD